MHDNTKQNTISDAIRSFVSFMCKGIYIILAGLYDILLDIGTNTDIISSETISHIFERIQLIIGIFMIFRLTMFALQSIIDPDKMTDSKSGVGNIIQKIIISLLMLSLIIPIKGIPDDANKYEKKIKEDGILFGTMNELQSRILGNNKDGKNVIATFILDPKEKMSRLNSQGQNLALIIAKGFVTPNLNPGKISYSMEVNEDEIYMYKKSDLWCYNSNDPNAEPTLKDQVIFAEEIGLGMLGVHVDGLKAAWDWYNENILGNKEPTLEEVYQIYYYTTDVSTLFGVADTSCTKPNGGNTYYAFSFNWFSSLLVGLICVVIFVMLCIEVGKRLIKLAILRLIAPIPIISYMNPKTDFNNGPMGAWLKLLISTYLDLFFHLAVIYFSIFLIQEINHSSVFAGSSSGIIAKIIVFIALLLFAKDSPKFIKQALGIKDDGGGFFSGIGKTLAGVGIGAAAAVGGFNAARKASALSDEANNRDPNSMRNKFKHGLSGFAGGLSSAYRTGKDVKGGTKIGEALGNQRNRSANAIASGAMGSSWWERTKDSVAGTIYGETPEDALKRQISKVEAENKLSAGLLDYAEGKAKKSDKTTGTYRGVTANFSKLSSTYANALNRGTGVYKTYADAYGDIITQDEYNALSNSQKTAFAINREYFDFEGQAIPMDEAEEYLQGILDENTKDMINRNPSGDKMVEQHGKYFGENYSSKYNNKTTLYDKLKASKGETAGEKFDLENKLSKMNGARK